MTKSTNGQGKIDTAEELAYTLSACSLSASEALTSELFEVLLESGLSDEQNYKLYMEVLTFFLLSFERYAETSGRKGFFDAVYNPTVNKTIRLVLDQIEYLPQFNGEDAFLSSLDYYNKAAQDYDTCQVLVERKPDYKDCHTVLGKLGSRIASALDKPATPEIIDMVSVVAAEALVESELKKKVMKASKLANQLT